MLKMLDVEMIKNLSYDVQVSKIDIAGLKPEDYKHRPDIIKKYFRNAEGKELDRLHLPEIDSINYTVAVMGMTKVPDRNKSFDTASEYYKRKIRLQILANDLGVNVKRLDATNYYWREDMYTESNFWVNLDKVENAYRNNGHDERLATANQVYIKQDPRSGTVEEEIYNSLFKLVWTAVKKRKVMLLQKIEPLIGFLNNICEYTMGFTQNCTRGMQIQLQGYVKWFEEYLNNKDVQKFLAENNDLTVYASDDSLRGDYIETYRRILNGISRGSGRDLGYFSELLSYEADDCVDEIIENRSEITFKSFE